MAAHFVLATDHVRQNVIRAVLAAPELSRVTLDDPQRTVKQNKRLWAMLTDVSQQVEWFGQKYDEDDWKDWFMHALRRARWMPTEEGGMVPIGLRTSKLSVADMSDLQELMAEFGARHNVVWTEPDQSAAAKDRGAPNKASRRLAA